MSLNKKRTLILVIALVFVLSFLSLVFWKLNVNPMSYINQLFGKTKNGSSSFGKLKESTESSITSNKSVDSVSKTPEEVAVNFDPTASSPTFAVESVNPEEKSLGLKFMFPPSSEGTSVNANITCKDDDIKIYSVTKEGSPEESVSADAFFARLKDLTLTDVLFSGTCSDATCNEIKSDCKLSVFPATGLL